MIIAGHGRVQAAEQLGLDEVPVMVAKGWSDAQKHAYIIADNAIPLNAGWDEKLLRFELTELAKMDYPISLVGFDDLRLAAFMGGNEGESDPDAEIDPVPDPVVRLGDIWTLGNHRIICGDSTDWETCERLLDGAQADLVFTDPPYGVSFQSGRSKGGTATRFSKIVNDDKILDIEPIVAKALRNDGAMFIWTSHHVYPQWRYQFAEYYKHTIIWHKPGGGIGDLNGNYATDYELCLFGVKGRPKFRGKRGMAVWVVAKDSVMDYEHPTQKPVELAARAIGDFTDHGGVVLDLFSGSGSTLIACEQTGRVGRVAELDPVYVDVALRRWAKFTGKAATLDGKTFEQVRKSRNKSAKGSAV
jgi:DNA modification methylase